MEASTDWRLSAACWDSYPVLDFVSPGPQDREEAEKLCISCAVAGDCLRFTLDRPMLWRMGISAARSFGHPSSRRRDARYGSPLGVCRHGPDRARIPTCETCWRNRLGLCRGCGHEWKQTGRLVKAKKEGRCWPCWREKKRETTARFRAVAKARQNGGVSWLRP